MVAPRLHDIYTPRARARAPTLSPKDANPNPASLILSSFRPVRQTQHLGNYYWKKSDEHQTYLDFEEQLMIVQELKQQGLVSCPPPHT